MRRQWDIPIAVTALLAVLQTSTFAQCEYDWDPGFALPGPDGEVTSAVVFDDGTGPALYVAGGFGHAGGVTAAGIVKWNGVNWAPLGAGVNNWVHALVVHDDGTGPALYAGGDFTTAGGATANRIAKWNGTSWSPLMAGATNGLNNSVYSLTSVGGTLYVGGAFTSAGGVTAANRIARWLGTGWAAVGTGSGANGPVYAITDWGGTLYVGGGFSQIGGVNITFIARWNGTNWSALGTGPSGGGGFVRALTLYDNGSGTALYVGGDFTTAGGITVNGIARWSGSAWSALAGGGVGGNPPSVKTLVVYDSGDGSALYAGGSFPTAGGISSAGIAKWKSSGWSALAGGGVSIYGGGAYVGTLAAYDDGKGAKLYAGGYFTYAGPGCVSYVGRWDGTGWSGLGNGSQDDILSLAVFDDGGGPALYAGGFIDHLGGIYSPGVAKWKSSRWWRPGTQITNEQVRTLAVLNWGGSPGLFAGGYINIGGINWITRWNGAAWAQVASGMTTDVYALAAFDGGGGTELCAGGSFTTIGATGYNRIAKWNGSAWSSLSSGMNGDVRAMIVFDDGTGPALYAGGSFSMAGGQWAVGAAKWNGSSWSSLCDAGSGTVIAWLVFDDDGPGPHAAALYASRGTDVARWNPGSPGTWTVVGTANSSVLALAAFDDGSGLAIYAGGYFTTIGGTPANKVAKWNGMAWSALGTGIGGSDSTVYALAGFDDGTGPALYVGGDFSTAGGKPSASIAKWFAKQVKPGITQAPASLSKKIGESAVFTVAASGTEPLSYRWRKDTVPLDDGGSISGAFTSALTIDPVGQADGGEYDVVVTNVCGSTPSTVATLTVATSLGDFDADGDVDLTDFAQFRTCFNGPNRAPAAAGCDASDFDADSDVDLTDFGQFRTCFNGPNRPPNC